MPRARSRAPLPSSARVRKLCHFLDNPQNDPMISLSFYRKLTLFLPSFTPAKQQILQGCVVLQVRRLRPGRLVRGFFFLYLFVGFVRASDFSFLCLSRLRLAGVELLLKRASGRLRVCARGSNQN